MPYQTRIQLIAELQNTMADLKKTTSQKTRNYQ
jgi:hypothetical protein